MQSNESLTIAIPTNGRPESLRSCLQSVQNHIDRQYEIWVLDSTPKDTEQKILQEYKRVCQEFPLNLLRYTENVPPGEARKILANHCQTEYIMFLDDDLEIQPSSFEKMFGVVASGQFDIVSGVWKETIPGVWREAGELRPIGFLYTFAHHGTEKSTVVKCPVFADHFDSDHVVTLDDVQASMLMKTSIFEIVNFDERYDFYFELYDFFLDCKIKGIKVGAHRGAMFHHTPQPYQSKSSRYFQKQAVDLERFTQKWGYVPSTQFWKKSPNPDFTQSENQPHQSFARKIVTRLLGH